MPTFLPTTTAYTVADFVGRYKRHELVVNRDYQRTNEVWPVAARSFLIESILLGFPVPKLTIREITDLKTRTTIQEIVDGQQRTRAIVDYFNNEFAITKRSEVVEARNCKYDDLPVDMQRAFMTYSIQADVLSGAKDEDIIELFRRINSNTVALNAEERRHAGSQGAMKWFVHEVAKAHGNLLAEYGVISLKQRARMQDAKLIAEITHATLNGITTTNARSLDGMYTSNDGQSFPGQEALAKRFKDAFAYVRKMPGLIDTRLSRHYHYYSLILAIMHATKPLDNFPAATGGKGLRDPEVASSRLLKLADALEADDVKEVPSPLQSFYKASDATTNTVANRTVRFKTFLQAVSK